MIGSQYFVLSFVTFGWEFINQSKSSAGLTFENSQQMSTFDIKIFLFILKPDQQSSKVERLLKKTKRKIDKNEGEKSA